MTTLYIDSKGAEIDVEGDTVVVRTDCSAGQLSTASMDGL
jgi:hypothetical protein